MDYPKLVAFIQSQFSDGLVLVVGSGLSAAEGIPGMGELAEYLNTASRELRDGDAAQLMAPKAKVVKAFNTVFAQLLPTEARNGKTIQVIGRH